mgnify:FL=1
MTRERRSELQDCQELLNNINVVTIRAAEAASTHLTRVMVEPDDLDKEVGEVYAQGVAELRQAFRTLSAIEDKLEPVAKSTGFFSFLFSILGGFFRRARV